MHKPTPQTFAVLGILTATGLMVVNAGAADLERATLTAPIGVGASGATQQTIKNNNSLLLAPTPTPAPVGLNPAASTAPAVKKSLTPDAAPSLSPQASPLGSLLKPMPGSSIDMAKPRIDSGIKAPSGLIQPATRTLGQAASPGVRSGMEDSAIIIIGGKQLTVGELKKNLFAEIAAKAGPPKTIKGGARKLDLAQPTPQNTMERNIGGRGNTSISPKSEKIVSLAGKGTEKVPADARFISVSETRCPDKGKGPPTIHEIKGKLIVGKKVTVWGECFGERTGRVEIIGPFPGGKLSPTFVSWDQNMIELAIPNISGATDNSAALTVVTADGKTSAAKQTQFVAARERIEVPDRLWSPNAKFELSIIGDATIGSNDLFSGPDSVNKAAFGETSMALRVNPQCWLDSMDATVSSGGINQIRGWEQGPPNEASVTIDWVGTCVDKITTTTTNYIIGTDRSSSTIKACRIAFQTRAWAYCPVGVAP